jgi:hypothetical protein
MSSQGGGGSCRVCPLASWSDVLLILPYVAVAAGVLPAHRRGCSTCSGVLREEVLGPHFGAAVQVMTGPGGELLVISRRTGGQGTGVILPGPGR